MAEPVIPTQYQAYARDPAREAELQGMGVRDPVLACVASQLEQADGFKLQPLRVNPGAYGVELSDPDKRIEAYATYHSNQGDYLTLRKRDAQDGIVDFSVGVGGGTDPISRNGSNYLTDLSPDGNITKGSDIVTGTNPTAASERHVEEHRKKLDAIAPCYPTS